MPRILSDLLLLLATTPLAAQATWIVDAGGGGDFLDVPPAIVASAPGDHILVLGSYGYSPFVVDRGIDIEATAAAITPTIEVVGVPAAQSARVAGFRVQRQGGVLSVSVRQCAGPVLLVDLIEFGPTFQVVTGQPGLDLADSDAVYVAGGTFLGQPGTSTGGEGLRMNQSRAVCVGATFVGGVDVSIYPSSGNRGRAGILLQNGSHAVCDAVSATAGPASQGNIAGGDGGHGIQVLAQNLAIVMGASQLVGTPGGWGSFFNGDDGLAISATNGSVRYTSDCVLTGGVFGAVQLQPRPQLSVPSTVAIGSSSAVDVNGAPGQFVGLAVDFAFGYQPTPAFDGALVLTPDAVFVALMLLDGSGFGSWPFVIPNVQQARYQHVFWQGIVPQGMDLTLSAPTQTRAY